VVGDREVKDKLTFSDQMYEGSHINALVDAFLDQKDIKVYQSKFAKPKSNDSIFEDYYPCRLKKINKSELAVVQESIKTGTTCALVSDVQDKYCIHYLGKDGQVLSKAVDGDTSAIVMSFDRGENEIPFAGDKQVWFENIVGKEQHQVKFDEKRTLTNKTFQTQQGQVVSVLNPIKNDLKAGDAGNRQTVHLGDDIGGIIKDWSWEIQQYFKENPSQEKTVTGLMPLCINQGHWVLLVIDIDKDQECTLKIKDSKNEAQWDKDLENLKSALKNSLEATKINPYSPQNISEVTFAEKDNEDTNIQQGNYCGGHVYRMMRDYIEHGDFYHTQKTQPTPNEMTTMREEDFNLVLRRYKKDGSSDDKDFRDFIGLYRYGAGFIDSQSENNMEGYQKQQTKIKEFIEQYDDTSVNSSFDNRSKTSTNQNSNISCEHQNQSNNRAVMSSRQAKLMPSFFSNQNVHNILAPLIVSSAKPVSKRDEAETTADGYRNQYFSNDQNISQSALKEALETFNRNQDRVELREQKQSKQSDISSNQDTKKVTATLQNFSNRQIAYSNPSEMNADQFKQAVLLSVPTASSQGEIKLSAKSSNFGVLLCFAKAMGEINKEIGSQKPLVLDFEKMKKSDEWRKAKQDFLDFDNESDFKDVLERYASGEQVYKSQLSINSEEPSLSDIKSLGKDALDFLADQNDLNESASSSFSCS
jgi:hypothetical protein